MTPVFSVCVEGMGTMQKKVGTTTPGGSEKRISYAPARWPSVAVALTCFALFLAVLALPGPASAKIEPEVSRAYYEKALGHVKDGKLRAAVIELKNALQRDPQNGEARLLLGETYVRLGDGGAAEKELRAARRYGISPERTVVPLGRALLLQGRLEELLSEVTAAAAPPAQAQAVALLRADAQAGLGRFDEARSSYEAIVQSHPEAPRAYLGLARLDLQARQFEAADKQAAAALARDPELTEAYVVQAEARRLQGEVEAALPLFRQAIDGKPPSATRLRAQLGLASSLIALQRDEEAEAELQELQASAPKVPLASYLRALIKLRAQDYEGARQLLDAAAPELDGFVPAQFLFGIVYFADDELETARAWLRRHLRAQPQNLQARKILAAALLRLNSPAEASEVLEAGLAQAPDDPQVLMLLGNAYLRSNRSEEASQILQRAAVGAPQDPRVFNQLAISLLATGEYDESLAALSTSLDLDSGASTLGYALAFMHLRSGAYDEALKVARELRSRFPDNAVAANLEGGAYAALGQMEQARASFEAVLEIDPDFHQARTNLATLKAQQGDIEGAEADYRKVLESDPGHAQALLGMAAVAGQQGDQAASREWLKKAVAANPDLPQPSFALVDQYLAADETTPALEVISALAERQPDNPQVLARLGRLQGQAGQHEAATETLTHLVEVTDGNAEARLLLAQAQLAAGEATEAREVLEAALAAQPGHPATVAALFQLLPRLEGPEATLAYAERLQRRYPEGAWPHRVIGDLHLQAGRREAAMEAYLDGWAKQPSAELAIALFRARQGALQGEKVLASLRDWLAQNPEDDRVRLVLAEGLLSQGEMAQARDLYESLKETQGNNPVIWNNLAWLYQQTGDARAVAHGERALELAPGQPAIIDTLGWILVDTGEVTRAKDLLRQAAEGAPGNPDIAYHYAVALHRSGDDAAARTVLQELLKTEANFADKAAAAALLESLSP